MTTLVNAPVLMAGMPPTAQVNYMSYMGRQYVILSTIVTAAMFHAGGILMLQ